MSQMPRPPELNPQATPAELAQLAQTNPSLHLPISRHRGTPTQLLQWIASSSPDEAARTAASERLSFLPPLPPTGEASQMQPPPTPAPGNFGPQQGAGGPAQPNAYTQPNPPSVAGGSGGSKRKLFSIIAVVVVVALGAVLAFNLLGSGGKVAMAQRTVPASPFEMSFDRQPFDISEVFGDGYLRGADPLGPYVWTTGDGDWHVYHVDADGASEVSVPAQSDEDMYINDSIAYIRHGNGQWTAYDLESGESSDIEGPSDATLTNVLAVSRGNLIFIVENDEGRKAITARHEGTEVWRHLDEELPASVEYSAFMLSADGRWLYNEPGYGAAIAINVADGTMLSSDDADHPVKIFMPLQDGILALPEAGFETNTKVTAFDRNGKRIEGEKYLVHGHPGLNYAPLELQYSVSSLTRDEPVEQSEQRVANNFVWALPNGNTREIEQSAYIAPAAAGASGCRVSVAIVNNDTRALCVDTNDHLVAVDIPTDEDRYASDDRPTPLWSVPGAIEVIDMRPFNGTGWLLQNAEHLYLFE